MNRRIGALTRFVVLSLHEIVVPVGVISVHRYRARIPDRSDSGNSGKLVRNIVLDARDHLRIGNQLIWNRTC